MMVQITIQMEESGISEEQANFASVLIPLKTWLSSTWKQNT
jgi:hypothetical protein